LKRFILALVSSILAPALVGAQSLVSTLTLGPDQIGLVRSAQGITTRITFAEPVIEIVCGDLYDQASGKGLFVVQRSGTADRPGNDVFIKPIASRGMSNLFVTTGESRRRTFNFDLKIVPVEQAHRVVNVVDSAAHAGPAENQASNGGEPRQTEPDRNKLAGDLEKMKSQAEEQAKQKAAEIIRGAQQQADRKIAEADARIAENERQASTRADAEVERRFLKALMLGVREQRIDKPRVTARRVIVSLDPRVLTFGEKAYLRYTIQNTGLENFSFNGLALEAETDRNTNLLVIEVNQSKRENVLVKDESLTGVIVFDAKFVGARDKLSLIVRADDNTEIARLIIQQP
jgi:hypothetical protein